MPSSAGSIAARDQKTDQGRDADRRKAGRRIAADDQFEAVEGAASGAPNAPAIPAAAPQPTRMRKSPRRKRNALPMRDAMPLASWV